MDFVTNKNTNDYKRRGLFLDILMKKKSVINEKVDEKMLKIKVLEIYL